MSLAKYIGQIGILGSLGCLGFVAVSFLSERASPTDNNVLTLGTENELMRAAEASATETLPRFLELAATNPGNWQDISVKVGIQGTEMVENIWIGDIEKLDETLFAGQLANEPVDLGGLEIGSRVEFDLDQITDWSVVIDGRGYGYYTVRAITDMVSDEEAAQINAFLSSDPLPPKF